MTDPASARAGALLGVGAYVLWGLLPLYLRLLADVPGPQVLAHRVLWSLLLVVVVCAVTGRVRATLRATRGRTLLLLIASALLIAANWLVYIRAVQSGHVLDASLGYFINPLINVALGVAVLGERLRRVQLAAIGIAGAGVLLLAVTGAGAIWVSVTLAVSFALYGLVRKVAAIDALGGLAVETALLAPVCLALVARSTATGDSAWGASATLDLLLVGSGLVTAAPLLLFASAARRLRYATLGLLQYIGPTLQFGLAIVVFGERVRPVQLVTFALIWAGCALYAWDTLCGSGRQPQPVD